MLLLEVLRCDMWICDERLRDEFVRPIFEDCVKYVEGKLVEF